MLPAPKLALFVTVTWMALLAVPLSEALPPSAPAPIPAQILTARKVFISNAGQDGLGGFSGDPNRAYNQFYAAVKTWGQLELVSSPADADLVLEISFDVQALGANVVRGDSVGPGYSPRFKLRILDAKTRFTLWAFTQRVQWALLSGNRDKNFDRGLTALVTNLKELLGQSPTAGDGPAK